MCPGQPRHISQQVALSEIAPQAREEHVLRIHNEISECRVCESRVPGFEKPVLLHRGDFGRVMIVGQGPGRSELKVFRAFAGQSGRTLEWWLVACGANPANPRAGIYFTSVIKCVCPSEKFFPLMARNCRGFLHRQIVELGPELVITLGWKSYEVLRVSDDEFDATLCVPRNTADFALVTPYGLHVNLLHWPHPSGRNRWLNNDENQLRLQNSFEFVRSFLGGEK
jgi:uracil-DNA glycosylase family 4